MKIITIFFLVLDSSNHINAVLNICFYTWMIILYLFLFLQREESFILILSHFIFMKFFTDFHEVMTNPCSTMEVFICKEIYLFFS